MRVVIALGLLITRCTVEKRSMFHAHYLIVNSGVEFVYRIYFNYEFDELENHQWSDFIEKALNKDCFESLIIKVVMLHNDVQEFNIIFLKTAILLFASLQFELDFHN